jgi:TatD DNase family protein
MKIENLKYIDCHSHPHDIKFLESGVDMDKVMQELHDDGGATIAIGTDYTETTNAINFAKKYANCWATIGIHPADNHAEIFDEEKFEELLELGGVKIVGVGECGLDYFYFDKILKENGEFDIEKEKTRQREIFIKQIEFACKHNLPLVLHGRPSKNSMDAYRDMLDILEKYDQQKSISSSHLLKGHAHFFVGNMEVAERFFETRVSTFI